MIKQENKIYEDLVQYVASGKKNRASVLAPLKKSMRTKKIIDFIFSHPEDFNLDKEVPFVPEECLNEEVLIKMTLSCPRSFHIIDEKFWTLPLLIAFEVAKISEENESSAIWGEWGEKLQVPERSFQYYDEVVDAINEIPYAQVDNKEAEKEEFSIWIGNMAREIIVWAKKKRGEILNFETAGRNLVILVSGLKMVGKHEFASKIQEIIEGSIVVDEDEIFERGLIEKPIEKLTSSSTSVVIFVGEEAHNFFSQEDLAGSLVTNIVVRPKDIKSMARYIRTLNDYDFDSFASDVESKHAFNSLSNPIEVINDFDGSLDGQVLSTIAEIARRLEWLEFGSPQGNLKYESAIIQSRAEMRKKLDLRRI